MNKLSLSDNAGTTFDKQRTSARADDDDDPAVSRTLASPSLSSIADAAL